MKRVIITGVTGAIGTALINECIDEGVEVLALCNPNSRRNSRIPQHELVTCIPCTLDNLDQLNSLSGKTYDVFFHLGWAGTTGQARNDMYLQNMNVRYALDAVDAAKRFGCSTFVGVGSQAEYGKYEGVLKPDTPVFPDTGYGIAKLSAGLMTKKHAQQIGIKHIWTRILSVYGPNDWDGSLVMSVISKLLAGEPPNLTKGEQKWDYLYSGDAASALIALSENGRDGKTYVLGSGSARPLSEYVGIIHNLLKSDTIINYGALPYVSGQSMYLQADISAIKEDTNWNGPQVSFENGILRILQS